MLVDQSQQSIYLVKKALLAGEVIALPTDTVYGFAVCAKDPLAVRRLFCVKQRPADVNFQVLVSSLESFYELVKTDFVGIDKILSQFWPGALTVVANRQSSIDWDLGTSRKTIGVRYPDNEFVQLLCELVEPLCATSANIHGEPALTSASEIAEEFSGDVSLVIDGEPGLAQPSTVIDISSGEIKLIRQGAIDFSEIMKCIR